MRGHGNGGRRLALVSDGSALAQSGPTVVEPVLRAQAELISDLAGLPTRAVAVEDTGPEQLAVAIRGVSAEFAAVLLTHAAPNRTRLVQRELRTTGGRPLVTDQDATAIALTAALLNALATRGRPLRDSRVVIAGSAYLPGLPPLLMAAGIRDITTWNTADTAVFPLHQVVPGADAVLDLADSLAAGGPVPFAVIGRDAARTAPCAAAGLLRAAVCAPEAPLGVEIDHLCALALAAATPADRYMAHGEARALTGLVADAATRALLAASRP